MWQIYSGDTMKNCSRLLSFLGTHLHLKSKWKKRGINACCFLVFYFSQTFCIENIKPVGQDWFLGLDCSSTETPVMRIFWESTACTLARGTPTNWPQFTATTEIPRWASGMILSAIKFTVRMELLSIPTLRRFGETWEDQHDYHWYSCRMIPCGSSMTSCAERSPWFLRRIFNRKACLDWDLFLGRMSLCLRRNIQSKFPAQINVKNDSWTCKALHIDFLISTRWSFNKP